MSTIQFSVWKNEIQKKLKEKLAENPIPGETDGFTLIDGFMTSYIQAEISGELRLGGPSVPVVGIVGNKSGRIYTFALKAILPDIQL